MAGPPLSMKPTSIKLRQEYLDAPYEYRFLGKDQHGKQVVIEVPMPMRLDANMQPVWPTERSEGIWWCNAHQREATHMRESDGKICCDPKLPGIMLPCMVVFAPVNPEWEKLGPEADIHFMVNPEAFKKHDTP